MFTPGSAKKPVRVGICGLGDWAWRHVKLLRETGGFEIVAISSRSDAAWQRARAELPGATCFRDHREMLTNGQVDLVVVTTPHHLHAQMAMDALRIGAHVIVEKPMATSLTDAQAMIGTARTTRRMLAVYHNRRFDPWLLAAKRIVDEGKLGRLVELNAGWPDNAPAGSWRRQKLESGGLFFDLGAHLTDYLTQLSGAQPVRVSGHVHRRADSDSRLNEDHVSAAIQFGNGARGRITISTLDHAPAYRFHLVGEAGTLTDAWNWGGGSGEVRIRAADGTLKTEPYTYVGEDDSGGGRPIYRNIAAHLFEGAPLAVPPEQALMNVAVLLAAQTSADRGGEWIELERFLRRP